MNPDRGAQLLAARKRAGLEQQEAAAQLGVTRGTLRRWERGHFVPRTALAQLSALYGVELSTDGHAMVTPLDPAVPVGPAPSAPRHLADQPTHNTGWPQFAREAWARLYLDLVQMGVDEPTIAFLRGFVLADSLLLSHSSHPDELRLDVEAGVAAARAWVAARLGTD